MNVPTLIFNPQQWEYRGKFYFASACPYLTEQTGMDWQKLEQLENMLKNMPKLLDTFNPRKWVLENMTDQISAQHLLNIIEETLKTGV